MYEIINIQPNIFTLFIYKGNYSAHHRTLSLSKTRDNRYMLYRSEYNNQYAL